MKLPIREILATIIFSIILSACGFHLRGDWNLAAPLRKMYLETKDPYGQLARELKLQLKASNISFVEHKNDAKTILLIEHDDIHQTLLGLNATQQTRQYKLTLTIRFIVQDQHGITILPIQTVEDSRVITIQSNQILGSSNEVNLFAQQMRRASASTILERLQSKDIAQLLDKHFKTTQNP